MYLSPVALNPLGTGWLMPAVLPSVFPASGAHPGPSQVCSDSGSCCGAWCLCGPSPCLVPGPFPYPYLDPLCLLCLAPSPSPSPCPAPGYAPDVSPALAGGCVHALLPSPAPSALLLLAPFAASPAPWPAQPAPPPSEQSVVGREGSRQRPQPCLHQSCTVDLHLDSTLLTQGVSFAVKAITSVLAAKPQSLQVFTVETSNR